MVSMGFIKNTLNWSVLFILIGALVYKNLIAPEDKNSPLSQIEEMLFPFLMLYSFFMLYLKRKKENKDKKPVSHEDRELFKSIGKSDWDERKKP